MKQGRVWAEMMVAAQKGNSQTYNRLLTELSSYVLSYLGHKLGSAADAQDVLQEVLFSVHKARHTFDGACDFKPWLFAVVQSRLIEFWRKNGRRPEVLDAFDDDVAETMVAEAEISFAEIRDLQSAFEKLPEQQRCIMRGLRLDGKSIKQLSAELAMSEAAVKVAAHRATKTVALELGVEV